jgi:hypothetical protein
MPGTGYLIAATASTGAATTAGSDAHHTCPDTTAMPGTGYLHVIAAAGAHHVQQPKQHAAYSFRNTAESRGGGHERDISNAGR